MNIKHVRAMCNLIFGTSTVTAVHIPISRYAMVSVTIGCRRYIYPVFIYHGTDCDVIYTDTRPSSKNLDV